MRKTITLSFLIVTNICFGQIWTQMGTEAIYSSKVDEFYPNIEINGLDEVYSMAFTKDGATAVKKFDGATWNSLPAPDGKVSGQKCLAFNQANEAHVILYGQKGNDYYSTVQKFSGAVWNQVGDTLHDVRDGQISFDVSSDVPVIAVLNPANNRLQVMKLVNNAWMQQGGDLYHETIGLRTFVMNVHSNGIYVAHQPKDSAGVIVSSFTGPVLWAQLGTSIENYSFDLNVSNGAPYLAILKASGEAGLQSYNGSVWQTVGTDSVAPAWQSNISLCFVNGQPTFAHRYAYGVEVRQFNGSQWNNLVNQQFALKSWNGPSITVNSSGELHLAVIDSVKNSATSNYAVKVFKLDMSTNVEKAVNQTVSVYPNPTSDQLTIVTNEFPVGTQVLDLQGKVIASYNSSQKTLDVKALKKGLYFIKLYLSTETKVIPFVKQ